MSEAGQAPELKQSTESYRDMDVYPKALRRQIQWKWGFDVQNADSGDPSKLWRHGPISVNHAVKRRSCILNQSLNVSEHAFLLAKYRITLKLCHIAVILTDFR